MEHRAEDITRYRFRPSDEYLLDTNVWMFVYGPQKPKDNHKVDVYSQALAGILATQGRIYIDVLIVSEFVNTYARAKWNLRKNRSASPADLKAFRKTAEFRPVAQDIAAYVKRVLQLCTRIEDGFELLAIDALIDEYAAGDSDFNDQVLTALCRRSGFKLVTDDGDFKGRGIPVITANRQMLAWRGNVDLSLPTIGETG